MNVGGPFDAKLRTRLVFGPGCVQQAGTLARERGLARAFLVTDAGIVRAGHAEHVEQVLREAGLGITRYDRVRENPTARDVEDCLEAARAADLDFLVGLGGGSSIDTAKGCNFLLTNGGRMEDYWGVGKATRPLLPLLAIPTTAGTGTEVQSFALISHEETHQKMACGDARATPFAAILDPELTLSQPERVTACTGMDALTHALETAVTRRRNAFSTVYSRQAFVLAQHHLPRVLERPDDVEARGAMLLAAAYAGIAIENSMLGAAHSLANPLTAHHGLAHGQAVGMMLPQVVRFNAADPGTADLYAELARAAGLASPAEDVAACVAGLVRRLRALLERARLPASLRECGVAPHHLPALAEEAAGQWTARFNPREVDAAVCLSLYQETLDSGGAGSRGKES